MKNFIVGILALAILVATTGASVANAAPQGKPLRVVLSRQSNVDAVGIVKNLGQKCPNVILTTDEKNSDFMLNAWGWSGNYRFMVIAHGGAMVYATSTAYLSNAVKDVCAYLNGPAARGGTSPY